MAQKQVVVIGGGVIGICTAFFLAEAGHDVVVIERRGNVAEEASYGNTGIIAPACVAPWAAPGMPRKMLSYLFKPETPLLFKPKMNLALWRWVRLWLSECELARYRINKTRMQRIAFYSQDILHQLRQHYQLDYEQTQGYLQLFRSEHDIQLAEPARALLTEHDIPHRMLDADAVRLIEPGLSSNTALAGALHFPQDEAGNCSFFTKQLKQIAKEMGVQFHFNSNVAAIQQDGSQIALRITDRTGDAQRYTADAVVVAAGVESARLLKSLGIRIPLYPVKGYSATASIKHPEFGPRASVMDESYKVAISRMDNRIRIAGIAQLGSYRAGLHETALRTLLKVANDWFPGATNYNAASFWCGARPMLPDGAPLLGSTSIRNLFINIGHGTSGWAMAAGSGKVLADVISERAPDIDLDGLTLSRYG